MATGGGSGGSGGAIAAAVIVPVVLGGGGLAVYFLTREQGGGKPQAQATGGFDPQAALDNLATAAVLEGGRIVSNAAKEVVPFVKKAAAYHPAVLAWQGTKQVMGDVKSGASTVYGDVRSGVGTAYNGTKAVAKGVIKYHPVSISYQVAKGTVSAAASTAKSAAKGAVNVGKKIASKLNPFD
jgi:hypothetical protein